jgi:ribonuclease HI
VRLYSDGAARGNPGLAGAGAVLVEPSGQVVDRIGKFLGTQTNNYAEYMGLLLGLRRARELSVREVEVFADSELMLRQLGGRYQVKSASLRPLYEEALSLFNDFERVKLVHVPREMNRAADEMSNRAIDERL